MRFRLVYEGPLHSNGAPTEKHGIRKQLHGQLKELWVQHENLREIADFPQEDFDANEPVWAPGVGLRQIARQHARCGFEFVPLVSWRFRLVCSLEILFLRRENPGAVVSGGDVDNRLKTLFDSLRLPKCDEITEKPEADEQPMFCLLEDDRLITEVKVTTDRLLTPLGQGESRTDVLLIISVELEQTSRLW
jgi:hypothetical protein